MNTPPIIENMLAGLEAYAARAFLRATEFAEPRAAEQFAWEVEGLTEGRLSLPWLIERAGGQGAVAADLLTFMLDRHWHYRFGNRKPPQWRAS